MSQVFISYRHMQPDEDLAENLCGYFTARGLPVFLDKHIQVGLDWIAEIEHQLHASRFFVVLLSERSIRSNMVRKEVKIADELRQQGRMVILPVRVGYEGALPYDLGAYLDSIQYAFWRPGEPENDLYARLHAAIREGRPLPVSPVEDPSAASLQALASSTEEAGAPLPAADPRIVMETGTLRLDSPFYVRRREDEAVERCLARRGSTVIVKGPRQSGKSSLLARMHAASKQKGRRSVYIDVQTFDAGQLASLGDVLRAIALRIARTLRTPVKPADVWDADLLGDKGSFADFLGQAVLEGTSSPVILLFDEMDCLFDQPYRDHLFSAVRSWHNNRATEEAWEPLHLVIGHATDPALWIQNLNESPFNVGERLRLGDFTHEQVEDLNTRHGRPLRTSEEATGLMRLVGGHPYLVRQALYVLATEGWSLADLRGRAFDDRGPFGDHLRWHLWSIHQSEPLRTAVTGIVHRNCCDDQRIFQSLLAAGLVIGETRHEARMRCDLYQGYFAKHL